MKNKIGFSLAELLVVVVVMAVLASVAVPKFRRVLDTRKTSEAEQMLSAVRMEQEKRCVLGKKYTDTNSKISVLAAAGKSANYSYELGYQGAVATNKTDRESDRYTLKMLSYRDGRICCEGAACANLNKSYPDCSAMEATLSSAEDECALEPPQVVEDAGCQGIAPVDTEMRDGCLWTLSYHCELGQWQPDAEWLKTQLCSVIDKPFGCKKLCPAHAFSVKTGDDCKCECEAGYLPLYAGLHTEELLSCTKKDDLGDGDDDEPEEDTGNITCITSAVWRQTSSTYWSEGGGHGNCPMQSHYIEAMPTDEWISASCSRAVGHLPSSCSSGAECDCEPGKKYYQVGVCTRQTEVGMGNCMSSTGGYCFTCRKVNSTSRCASWSSMNTKQCGSSSNGNGNTYDIQPVDNTGGTTTINPGFSFMNP